MASFFNVSVICACLLCSVSNSSGQYIALLLVKVCLARKVHSSFRSDYGCRRKGNIELHLLDFIFVYHLQDEQTTLILFLCRESFINVISQEFGDTLHIGTSM